MDRLATALYASWTKVGPNDYRIERTRQDRKRLFSAHIRIESSRFQHQVAHYVSNAALGEKSDRTSITTVFDKQKELNSSGQSDPFALQQASEAAAARLPVGKAMARLLEAVDPKVVAERLDGYSVIVFSNEPTNAECPFSRDVSDVIDALNQTFPVYREVRDGLGRSEGFPAVSDRPVKKVLLEVKRSDPLSNWSAYLTGWDGEGNTCIPEKQLFLQEFDPPDLAKVDPKLRYVMPPENLAYRQLLLASWFPGSAINVSSADNRLFGASEGVSGQNGKPP